MKLNLKPLVTQKASKKPLEKNTISTHYTAGNRRLVEGPQQ